MTKFFQYLATPAFRKNLLIAAGSILSLIVIAFFSLNLYTSHGEAVPVPKLQGLSMEKAIEVLEREGFNYQIDSVYQANLIPGTVAQQDPDQGTLVKRNRVIYLTINTRTAPNVGFPDIMNKSFLEAQTMLHNYGLEVGDTTYVSDIERNRVLEVKFGGVAIGKGQELPRGSRIDLVLGDGLGASDVDLPDLTGFTLAEAAMKLSGMSLSLGVKTFEGPITDSTSAVVIRQFPALSDSLTSVPIGTKVDVTLSNQPIKP